MYAVELASDNPIAALELIHGRLLPMEMQKQEGGMEWVGTAGNFSVSRKGAEFVLACFVDVDNDKYHNDELLNGTSFYVGNHKVVGPLR